MGTKPSMMARIRNRVHKVTKNRSGQTLTEYVLILAIVFMIAVKMKDAISDKVTRSLGTVDKAMDEFDNSN